jgi:hypothetical protein
VLLRPDRIPQSQSGPDVVYELAEVRPGLPEPVVNAAKLGTLDEPLLVEHPLAGGRQPALGCCQHGLAQVGQAGDPVLAPGVDLGEMQRPRCEDLVKVPVDEIDLSAVDRQLGPAVHDAPPLAGSENPAWPAKRNDVGRVEPVPVVQAEVPVRPLRRRIRRPRPSQGDSDNPGNRG